jgi:two-component system, chemotaxis family, chemotaxis protein CheY
MIAILVVDDSALNRKLVIRAVSATIEATVTQAANGQEALALLRAGHYDLMLLDLNMPVMDGYQLLEAIRAENVPACPVVVLSGDIQPQAQARVLSLGAARFLKKPPVPAELIDALRSCGVATP